MSKIGYKLGGDFCDVGHDGYSIGFEILFPHVYSTSELAEWSNQSIYARMEKEDDQSVVIRLYEKDRIVDTIKWDEWWRYRCYRIKDAKKGDIFVEGHIDFEPYSEKFEKIFDNYVGDKVRNIWQMQYLSYWTEPTVIGEDE